MPNRCTTKTTCTWMGDHLQVGEPSWYVTSQWSPPVLQGGIIQFFINYSSILPKLPPVFFDLSSADRPEPQLHCQESITEQNPAIKY